VGESSSGSPAPAPVPVEHAVAPDPLPPGGMLVLRAWEVRMDAGGPGPLRGVRALGCWLGASLPQGHVASPDPSQSGERVWGRWPGEVRA